MEEGQRRGGMEWEAMYPKVSFHPTPLWEVWVPDSAAPHLELSACLFWCSGFKLRYRPNRAANNIKKQEIGGTNDA